MMSQKQTWSKDHRLEASQMGSNSAPGRPATWEGTTEFLTAISTSCIAAFPAAWPKKSAGISGILFVGQLVEMLRH